METKYCMNPLNKFELKTYSFDNPMHTKIHNEIISLLSNCFPDIYDSSSKMNMKENYVFILTDPSTKHIYSLLSLAKDDSLKNTRVENRRFIWDVCTNMDDLRQGCSEKLFHFVFEKIKSMKLPISFVYLYVDPNNIPARRAYEKLGIR